MERKEYNKMYMRKRREQLTERGICPVCGCRPKLENFARCEHCLKVQQDYRKRIKEIIENAR